MRRPRTERTAVAALVGAVLCAALAPAGAQEAAADARDSWAPRSAPPAPHRKPGYDPMPTSLMERPVVVRIRNVEPPDAVVRLALYFDEKSFLDTPTVKMTTAAEKGVAVFRLRGLSPGHYAFAAYADQNGDGELNRGSIGRPKEPVIFSGNVTPKLRKPTFDETKVPLVEGAMVTVEFDK